MPPEYDYDAADQLSRALKQCIERIDWFLWLRNGRRKALLSTPHSDNWQGAKRNHYERDFARQQAALRDLMDEARRLHARVGQATEQARAQHAQQKN
ncbi:hypothetical protein [Streptomyces sp. GESEQ-4]|jgi:hypothetical protein|uniref:hypothetical protein n=1 Tax=Streptomyces sp. GESEQ-4 TaxID=2812655 RepID=UPI001B32A188|nr:hypothetical protein [Streptomyces sp. GESEQ-4]